MFYDLQLLRKKSNGKFSIIWLAATNPSRLRKRDYLSVQVHLTAEAIMGTIKSAHRRFSLYLSSQLMFGLVHVFGQQVTYLYNDVSSLKIERPRPLSATKGSKPKRQSKGKATLEPEISLSFNQCLINMPDAIEPNCLDLRDPGVPTTEYLGLPMTTDKNQARPEEITLRDPTMMSNNLVLALDDDLGGYDDLLLKLFELPPPPMELDARQISAPLIIEYPNEDNANNYESAVKELKDCLQNVHQIEGPVDVEEDLLLQTAISPIVQIPSPTAVLPQTAEKPSLQNAPDPPAAPDGDGVHPEDNPAGTSSPKQQLPRKRIKLDPVDIGTALGDKKTRKLGKKTFVDKAMTIPLDKLRLNFGKSRISLLRNFQLDDMHRDTRVPAATLLQRSSTKAGNSKWLSDLYLRNCITRTIPDELNQSNGSEDATEGKHDLTGADDLLNSINKSLNSSVEIRRRHSSRNSSIIGEFDIVDKSGQGTLPVLQEEEILVPAENAPLLDDNLELPQEDIQLPGDIMPEDNRQVAGDGIQPRGDGVQPDGDGIQPHGDDIQPHGDDIQPHGDNIQPHGDNIQPHGDGIQPLGDDVPQHLPTIEKKKGKKRKEKKSTVEDEQNKEKSRKTAKSDGAVSNVPPLLLGDWDLSHSLDIAVGNINESELSSPQSIVSLQSDKRLFSELCPHSCSRIQAAQTFLKLMIGIKNGKYSAEQETMDGDIVVSRV